ncbi:MAG: prephenate dehydratase [Campylobacterales bacterium]|nr:prephenate dehydratase [Campylobacterales bacterium]
MASLDELRNQIDNCDSKIIDLLNQRMSHVHQVGVLKNATGGSIYRPEREKSIINRLKKKNDGLLNDNAIEAIFLEIFAVSRNLERSEKVAYLGPEGTYTHQAAESRFGAMSEYLSMSSIRAVFDSIENKMAKYGVVPIENNIDGVVGETLDLLGNTDVKIVAELTIGIHHSFASKTPDLKDIKKIYSKDKAFGQCRSFLSEYSLEDAEHIPIESTAKAAKIASEEPNSAAICSHIATKLYDVPVLFENIEDNHNNQTRFIVISDYENVQSGCDKTTILAKTPDEAGALARFLTDFHESGINLTKIESRPNKGNNDFASWFYIDFEGHFKDTNVAEVMNKHSEHIKWLGSYAKNSN